MSSYATINADDFTRTKGLHDWGVLGWHAYALFETGDFATGLALVNEVGGLAEEANHHPDVCLRYGALAVRVGTHDTLSLTTADTALATGIMAAAQRLGVAASPQNEEVDRSLWQM
ncbi:MAG: 4a-hydroxytetrahydrobiopterin dehydratase [Nocardioidaceae bacterium]|nr:4a-hydroxytetrahydrobiopterin dehydratase [Nocardioidaceae bacterium]